MSGDYKTVSLSTLLKITKARLEIQEINDLINDFWWWKYNLYLLRNNLAIKSLVGINTITAVNYYHW